MVVAADTPTVVTVMDIIRIDQINSIIAADTTTTGVFIESLSALKMIEVKTRSIICTEAAAWSGTFPVPRVAIGAIVATIVRNTETTFLQMSKLMPTDNVILIVLQQRQIF